MRRVFAILGLLSALGTAVLAPPAASAAAAASPVPTVTVITPSGAVVAQFPQAFAERDGIPPSDVTAPRGTYVHEAYVASDGTYWGLAKFYPSPTAGLAATIKFQDGANIGIFREFHTH